MPVDLDKAATTLTNAARNVVNNSGLAAGISSAAGSIDSLKNKLTNGASSLVSGITNSIPGVSTLESALQNAKNNVNKLGDIFQNAAQSTVTVPSGIDGRVPNVLHYYSSFNYIFTLSVLDDAQINFPNDTYRKGLLGPLLLKSGSGDPTNRVPTANKTKANPSGSFDFYIEDVEIQSQMGFERNTGNTNATGFKFKIIEPYSMGMWFQTLQAAAIAAGHRNYLDMPLLLTLEFKGHIDADLQNVQIDKTTKYFPMKLRQFGIRVTAKGSEYDIDGYAFNEKSLSTIYNQLKTDMSITGATVAEMLQTGEKSLQSEINKRLNEAKKRNDVAIPDQILISFPKDLKTGQYNPPSTDSSNPRSATVNPNSAQTDQASSDFFKKIGLVTSKVNGTQVQETADINDLGASTMGFNLYNKGDTPFAKDNLAYDEKTGTYKRGNITINPSVGEFKFAQGSDIINAINQVLLMSEYGRTALTQVNNKTGLVKWWRIEPHMFYIPSDANLAYTGQKPKLVVYRVVPVDVDVSFFLPPNASRPGTEEAKKQVVKEYNYIYTGKNLDVLDFDIELRAGFFSSIAADSGGNNEGKQIRENTGGASDGQTENKNATPSGQAPVNNVLPTSMLRDSVGTTTGGKGGGGLDDAASIAARQFHDSITAGVDMTNLQLKILGDPYYIADSGVGNYTAVATDNRNINADGSADYQRGPVHVLVNFRTPIDIDQASGLYDFVGTAEVPQFSGLYQVNRVTSNFIRGKFTQTLIMMRLRGQDIPSSGPPKLVMTPNSTTTSEALINEDGLVSNFRRNNETGELYDATGLYDNQGRALT